jgi:hypothetical protein
MNDHYVAVSVARDIDTSNDVETCTRCTLRNHFDITPTHCRGCMNLGGRYIARLRFQCRCVVDSVALKLYELASAKMTVEGNHGHNRMKYTPTCLARTHAEFDSAA